MSTLTADDGTSVQLGAVLAKAGEGSVYEVTGRADVVAKVFHTGLSDLSAKLDKVAAMVHSAPPGAVQADGFVVLTWPRHVVLDTGRPVGYLMPRIDTATAVEIHTMSNPFNRAHPLPGAPQWTTNATWAHLVNVAANLCLAVQVVHRVDAVIGDFQERNILVSNTARVTLVDCDSMQFTDTDGRQFLCTVGRPEFTAPELAEVNLRTQPRGKRSDLFALAVHIYQLLMAGNHPFMRGVWTGAGEQPGALSLAKAGWWAGGPGSPLSTHPLAPPPAFLPTDIGALFTRAFTDGAADPAARPSPEEWRQTLLGIRTTSCAQGSHQIPVNTPACPWCAIDTERTRRRRSRIQSGTGDIELQRISHIAPDTSRPTPVPFPPLVGRTMAFVQYPVTPPPVFVPALVPPRLGRGTARAPAARPALPSLGPRALITVSVTAVAMVALSVTIFVGVRLADNSNIHTAPATTTTTSQSNQSTTPTTSESSEVTTPTTSKSVSAAREATEQAVANAQVGDCIRRVRGTISLIPCESGDATDQVIMRAPDPNNCTGPWVRTTYHLPPVVLCLSAK